MIFNNGIFIHVDSKRCLNQIHTGVKCDHCVMHCPAEALSINRSGVSINKDQCYGCGLCFSECPTEVFSEPHWDETTIINEVKSQGAKVTQFFCEKHEKPYRSVDRNENGAIQIPACLSSLSKGAWYEIGMLTSVELHLENCSDCSMKECIKRLDYSIETASEWLISSGKTPQITYNYQDELARVRKKHKAVSTGMKVTSRRDLFLNVIGQGARMLDKAINKSSNDQASNRKGKQEGENYLPNWKKKFEVKYTENFQAGHTPAYWPSLEISSDCVYCGMCSKNCPSGALKVSTEDGQGTHVFVSGNCLDCRICMLFCPTESISRDRVQIEDPFQKQYIKRGEVIACLQCGGTALSSTTKLCYLCENEAQDSDMIANVFGHLNYSLS